MIKKYFPYSPFPSDSLTSPQALGLHQHEGHDDHAGHEEEEETGEHNTLNKCMGVLGGIYIFLLFEKAIHSVIPHDHGHSGDGHEHVSFPCVIFSLLFSFRPSCFFSLSTFLVI